MDVALTAIFRNRFHREEEFIELVIVRARSYHASRMATRPSWPDHTACTVEVLVVPGCPGAQLTLARVHAAAEALGIDTNLRVVTVDEVQRAQELGFVGSPTVRVEGRDVEDVEGRPIGLACRLYGGERAPSSTVIRAAIAAASGRT
jgi:hypothetical protein